MTHTSSNPSECVLVPREPTEAMLDAVAAWPKHWGDYEQATKPMQVAYQVDRLAAVHRYRNMLAAAPTPAIAGEGLREAAENAAMYLDSGFLSCPLCGHEVPTQGTDAEHELRAALASPSLAVPSSDDRERLVEALAKIGTVGKVGTLVNLIDRAKVLVPEEWHEWHKHADAALASEAAR